MEGTTLLVDAQDHSTDALPESTLRSLVIEQLAATLTELHHLASPTAIKAAGVLWSRLPSLCDAMPADDPPYFDISSLPECSPNTPSARLEYCGLLLDLLDLHNDAAALRRIVEGAL